MKDAAKTTFQKEFIHQLWIRGQNSEGFAGFGLITHPPDPSSAAPDHAA